MRALEIKTVECPNIIEKEVLAPQALFYSDFENGGRAHDVFYELIKGEPRDIEVMAICVAKSETDRLNAKFIEVKRHALKHPDDTSGTPKKRRVVVAYGFENFTVEDTEKDHKEPGVASALYFLEGLRLRGWEIAVVYDDTHNTLALGTALLSALAELQTPPRPDQRESSISFAYRMLARLARSSSDQALAEYLMGRNRNQQRSTGLSLIYEMQNKTQI